MAKNGISQPISAWKWDFLFNSIFQVSRKLSIFQTTKLVHEFLDLPTYRSGWASPRNGWNKCAKNQRYVTILAWKWLTSQQNSWLKYICLWFMWKRCQILISSQSFSKRGEWMTKFEANIESIQIKKKCMKIFHQKHFNFMCFALFRFSFLHFFRFFCVKIWDFWEFSQNMRSKNQNWKACTFTLIPFNSFNVRSCKWKFSSFWPIAREEERLPDTAAITIKQKLKKCCGESQNQQQRETA